MTFSTLASPGVSLQGGGGSGGGGGTPGGSDTQIQYNSSGTFAGASGLTTNGTELTIASGTKTADAPVLNMSQTWNNAAVTFTGLKFNATDTASAAASLLMDLQTNTGGAPTSRFRITKSGSVTATDFTAGSVAIADSVYISSTQRLRWFASGFTGSTDLEIGRRAAANLRFGAADAAAPVAQTLSVQSVVAGTTNTAGANLTITGSQGTGSGAGGSIIFQVAPAGSSGSAQNSLVTFLEATSARAFNLYNTTDVTTNFERGFAKWNSNVLQIGTDKGGTGTARALEFQTDGTTRLTIPNSSANAVFVPGVTAAGFAATAGGSYYILNRLKLFAASDGVASISNAAATDFNRLQFGGTTSSFPALKRNTTSLQAVLADDTGFTNIQGKLTTDTAYTAGDPATTGYLVVYDSTGTAYKIPALAV